MNLSRDCNIPAESEMTDNLEALAFSPYYSGEQKSEPPALTFRSYGVPASVCAVEQSG